MKSTIISVIIAVALIGGAYILTRDNSISVQDGAVKNVYVEDGVQIVEINARGGYSPRRSIAKAGIPTVLRFNTKGTFDCSALVRIASLDITEMLPQTGSTDINIGSFDKRLLQGSCGMGMYSFEIDFKE